MESYDYLVVGAGLFGSVFAQRMSEIGRSVLVIEKRSHIGGNCYTEKIEGIDVHRYGPHIFHTSSGEVWNYINRFAEFIPFVNRPKVSYKGRIYSFPINLMTLHQLWGVTTPGQAAQKLREVRVHHENPANMEEWLLSNLGRDIYEIFFRGYTAKQWQKSPRQLPVNVITRLPVRLSFDDNYYQDRFQAIPAGGYTRLFERLLEGVEVQLDTDYLQDKPRWDSIAESVVYTGKLDEYYSYCFGELEYRGLRFESEIKTGDYQGNAVINYTAQEVPYTRVIEHKHFAENRYHEKTIVTWEFPTTSDRTAIPYYPVNTPENDALHAEYVKMAQTEKRLVLGGRLATYKYLDMDDVVLSALRTAETLKSRGQA
jgi:UDP-galactopyranose mutase